MDATEPDVLVAEFELRAEVGEATVHIAVVQVLRFRDGRIAHLREYFSPAMRGELERP